MQPRFERQTATRLGNSETMTITNEAIWLSPTARRARKLVVLTHLVVGDNLRSAPNGAPASRKNLTAQVSKVTVRGTPLDGAGNVIMATGARSA